MDLIDSFIYSFIDWLTYVKYCKALRTQRLIRVCTSSPLSPSGSEARRGQQSSQGETLPTALRPPTLCPLKTQVTEGVLLSYDREISQDMEKDCASSGITLPVCFQIFCSQVKPKKWFSLPPFPVLGSEVPFFLV